jgi:hypothetical protein
VIALAWIMTAWRFWRRGEEAGEGPTMEEKEISKKAAGVSAANPENCFEMKSSPAPGAASVTQHPILVD